MSPAASLCEAFCDCEGCSDHDLIECIDDLEDSEKEADEMGCENTFDAWLTCIEEEQECNGEVFKADGCDNEESGLRRCLKTPSTSHGGSAASGETTSGETTSGGSGTAGAGGATTQPTTCYSGGSVGYGTSTGAGTTTVGYCHLESDCSDGKSRLISCADSTCTCEVDGVVTVTFSQPEAFDCSYSSFPAEWTTECGFPG